MLLALLLNAHRHLFPLHLPRDPLLDIHHHLTFLFLHFFFPRLPITPEPSSAIRALSPRWCFKNTMVLLKQVLFALCLVGASALQAAPGGSDPLTQLRNAASAIQGRFKTAEKEGSLVSTACCAMFPSSCWCVLSGLSTHRLPACTMRCPTRLYLPRAVPRRTLIPTRARSYSRCSLTKRSPLILRGLFLTLPLAHIRSARRGKTSTRVWCRR